MVVRFITRRFIEEYDPNLERVYTFNTLVDNELVLFEILDAAGQIVSRYYFFLQNLLYFHFVF